MKKMRQAAKRTSAVVMAAMMAMGGLPQTVLADGENVTTISLYPANGSLSSGVVSGYLGDFFASKGLEVEVWAYSDEKTNAILASSDLPDIMYVTAENLQIMIDSGMVLKLDEYIDQMPHVKADEEILVSLEYVMDFKFW